MTRGQDFIENATCTHGQRSAMNNPAWCHLKKKLYSNEFTRSVP